MTLRRVLGFNVKKHNKVGILQCLDFVDAISLSQCAKSFRTIDLPCNHVLRYRDNMITKTSDPEIRKYTGKVYFSECTSGNKKLIREVIDTFPNLTELYLLGLHVKVEFLTSEIFKSIDRITIINTMTDPRIFDNKRINQCTGISKCEIIWYSKCKCSVCTSCYCSKCTYDGLSYSNQSGILGIVGPIGPTSECNNLSHKQIQKQKKSQYQKPCVRMIKMPKKPIRWTKHR